MTDVRRSRRRRARVAALCTLLAIIVFGDGQPIAAETGADRVETPADAARAPLTACPEPGEAAAASTDAAAALTSARSR